MKDSSHMIVQLCFVQSTKQNGVFARGKKSTPSGRLIMVFFFCILFFFFSSTLVDLGTLIKNSHCGFISAWFDVNFPFSQTAALFWPKESMCLLTSVPFFSHSLTTWKQCKDRTTDSFGSKAMLSFWSWNRICTKHIWMVWLSDSVTQIGYLWQ